VADLPLQFPELAVTDMLLYVPIAGLFQFGAFVQSRPLITAMSLQVTVGGLIVVPAMPIEGTSVQVSVYVIILELLLDVTDELLGTREDELATADELSCRQELLESWALLSLPSSPEQENVNVMASIKVAVNASLENCVLIVCSPLVVLFFEI